MNMPLDKDQQRNRPQRLTTLTIKWGNRDEGACRWQCTGFAKWKDKCKSYHFSADTKRCSLCSSTTCDDVRTSTMQVCGALKEAATKHGLRIGTAVSSGWKWQEDSSTVREQFDTVVAVNSCKFGVMHPEKDKWRWDGCDGVYKIAAKNQMDVRGHVLIWHSQNGKWVEDLGKTGDKAGIIAALEGHIQDVMTRYKGKTYAWDVVNEAVLPGKMRPSVWYDNVPDFIDRSFRAARAADANAKLFYNDYGAESVNSKSDFIYNMCKRMIEADPPVPIDGVGFQMHVDTINIDKQLRSIKANFQRFAALEIEIHVTEMDVLIRRHRGHNERLQAQMFAGVLKICVDIPQCTAFLAWGVSDKTSWKKEYTPLIFDPEYAPKPAFAKMVRVLADTKATPRIEVSKATVDLAN